MGKMLHRDKTGVMGPMLEQSPVAGLQKLERAGSVLPSPRPQDQVMGPRKRVDAVKLHKAQPVDDTRQLGGDAVFGPDGRLHRVFRPPSPDARPSVDELVGAVGAARIVARNALVLAGPPGAAALDLTADAMVTRLGGGRLAMGDPMSVPAGRYAQQAFEALGLWPAVSARLLTTENVRAALAYVARGDVPTVPSPDDDA
mgnify:CR=1 FL=1